jgi:hypothetical protein
MIQPVEANPAGPSLLSPCMRNKFLSYTSTDPLMSAPPSSLSHKYAGIAILINSFLKSEAIRYARMFSQTIGEPLKMEFSEVYYY